jgi:hypothetical protein
MTEVKSFESVRENHWEQMSKAEAELKYHSEQSEIAGRLARNSKYLKSLSDSDLRLSFNQSSLEEHLGISRQFLSLYFMGTFEDSLSYHDLRTDFENRTLSEENYRLLIRASEQIERDKVEYGSPEKLYSEYNGRVFAFEKLELKRLKKEANRKKKKISK